MKKPTPKKKPTPQAKTKAKALIKKGGAKGVKKGRSIKTPDTVTTTINGTKLTLHKKPTKAKTPKRANVKINHKKPARVKKLQTNINKHSDKIVKEICDKIATSSISVVHILQSDKRYPAPSTWFEWLKKYPNCAENYAAARAQQAHYLADEIIAIADNKAGDVSHVDEFGNPIADHEFIARSRLKVDARKWAAAKLLPKVYGDKVDVTSDGEKIGGSVFNVGFSKVVNNNEISE